MNKTHPSNGLKNKITNEVTIILKKLKKIIKLFKSTAVDDGIALKIWTVYCIVPLFSWAHDGKPAQDLAGGTTASPAEWKAASVIWPPRMGP
jgi:hypothetical protein